MSQLSDLQPSHVENELQNDEKRDKIEFDFDDGRGDLLLDGLLGDQSGDEIGVDGDGHDLSVDKRNRDGIVLSFKKLLGNS